MKKETFLSVVVPAFNEAENFKKGCLDQVGSYLKKQNYTWEVILVDDGSTDETPKLLRGFVERHKGFRCLKISHGGKLAAVRTGVRVAKGKYVLLTDFDQSTRIEEIERVLEEFKKGAQIVIGRRYGRGAERRDYLMARIRGGVFRRLAQFLVGRGIEDTQCGFKAFQTSVARELFVKLKVYKPEEIKGPFMGIFDVELLLIAQKQGLNIAQVPVKWTRKKSGRLTFVEPLMIAWALFKIWVFNLLGRYKERKRIKR